MAINNGTPLGRMVIEMDLDSTGFNKNLTSTNQAIKSAEKEMKANLAVMNSADDKYGALSKQVEGLNKIMKLNESRIEQLNEKRRKLLLTEDASSEAVQKLNNEINTAVTRQAKLQQTLNRTSDRMQEFEEETRQASSTLGKIEKSVENFSNRANKMGDALNKTVTPALGAMAIAIGKVGTDADTSTAKLKNALGLTVEESKKAQKSVNEVWSDGFGDSMESVTDAVLLVKQNMRELNDVELVDVTKQAMVLAETFDADVGEVTRSAQNLMKNFGLTSVEAFDMLAKAGQNGLNFSNEMFDNVAEYAGLWKNLGFSAEEMFGTLISGTKEGVYNLDYLNDMVKEFGIRLVDGSDSTAAAMTAMFSPVGFYDFVENLKKNEQGSKEYMEVSKKMGKEYTDMIIADLKKGGKAGEDAWKALEYNMGRGSELVDGITDGSISGQQAMKEIAEAIAKMDDPMLQAQHGVALFGTKFEDLGTSAALNMMTAGESLEDFNGSAKEMAETAELTFGQQATALFREYGEALIPLGETMLELAKDILPKVSEVTKDVSEWIGNLSENGKKAVLIAGAFGIALGPALKILSSFLKLKLARKAFAGFNSMIGMSTAGITAETTALNANTRAQQRNNRARGGVGGGGRGRTVSASRRTPTTPIPTTTSVAASTPGKGVKVAKALGKAGKVAGPIGAVVGVGALAYELKNGSGSKESIGGGVGGLLGGIGGGAAAGAAVGSVVPVIGTAIGAVAGGIIGGIAGDKIGASIGKTFDSKEKKEQALKKAEKTAKSGASLDLKIKGVDESTQKALGEYDKLYEGAKIRLNKVMSNNTVVNARIKNDTIKQFDGMKTSVLASVDERHKEEIAKAQKALASNKNLTQQEKDDALNKMRSKHSQERKIVTDGSAKVKAIMDLASKEKRALTTGEKNAIKKINEDMYNTKINKTAKSESEITKIQKQRSKQRNDITTKEMNATVKSAEKEYKSVVKSANDKYKKKVENARVQYKELGVISKKEYDQIVEDAQRQRTDTVVQAKRQKDSVVKHANERKDKTSKASEKEKKNAIKNAKDTTSGMEKAWNGFTGFFKKAWDWLAGLFGGNKASAPPTAKSSNTKSNSGKTNSTGNTQMYAKGTINGSHPGGKAIVGEIGPELGYIPGKGYSLLGANGPSMYDLPRGSAVLPHDKTASMLSKYNFPMYAKGTDDDSLFDKLGNYVKDGVGYLKNKAVDAYDFISGGTSAAYKKITSSFGFENKFPTALNNITKDGMGKWAKTKTIDMIQSMFDSYDAGGDSTISNGYGVYDYLYNVAKRVMSSDKGRGLTITSGHREGDSLDHGKHNAIDLSGFGSNGGYKNVAKWASTLPGVSYTIGDNTVFGKKYGNGKKPKWAGGHMNHVHISGIGGATGNTAKWKSIATQALKMTGDYSAANLNALLYQMGTESGGNARAINNWDSNAKKGTPSKGLMQVIDPTFKAYAQKGYSSNIYDPLSNILASINYTKSRYGSLSKGWKGKGYENGGIIDKQHLAMLGEGNKKEVVIPLQPKGNMRSRALDLLAYASEHLLGSNSTSSTSSSVDGNSMVAMLVRQDEQINLLQKSVELLAQIVTKDNSVYLDSKVIKNGQDKLANQQQKITKFARGLV